MISYGNPNIFFANIGRGDVDIAPYNRTLNRDLKRGKKLAPSVYYQSGGR